MSKAFLSLLFLFTLHAHAQQRKTQNFDKDWKFRLGDDTTAKNNRYDDSHWRRIDLPHDWSIEGPFSESNPGTSQEAALPTGTGWYRKSFVLPPHKDKRIYIEFDGIYRNSEVWINGHWLGRRPYGYSSFRYELTPWLRKDRNCLAVRVDNSEQPDSRWYTGSGIYRHVRLVTTGRTAVDYNGSFVTLLPGSGPDSIETQTRVTNGIDKSQLVRVTNELYNAAGHKIATAGKWQKTPGKDAPTYLNVQRMPVPHPQYWSIDHPYRYKLRTTISVQGRVTDTYTTRIGLRRFYFDPQKGFFLNGQSIKIKGVCEHHDLGALGAAVNTRAIERQLQLLKAMGCNAIRTAHNPPAPELLDLCDSMGFLVLDEAFDMWRKKKNNFDYHLDFDQWHKQDLQDMVKRDRNHPCVFMWSIGNEIREQFDSSGIPIARELVALVKELDTTRPVTCALSEPDPAKNFIYRSGVLDLVGLNYHPEVYAGFADQYPGQAFIATETMSALASRGHYDMPSDSVRYWPAKGEKTVAHGNPDYTVSAYDNVAAYWGSTHEATWKIIKKYPHCSGLFVWSGFDYLGEPVPYTWPARSSYYGIIDLAGFPKDVYYMYQSEWTDKPVLHLLPHWNWAPGQVVDVMVYYSQADEVELWFNGQSLGIKKKQGDDLHLLWRVPYQPGVLKAVSRRKGRVVLTTETYTAAAPAALTLHADRTNLEAGGDDLCFITVQVTDAHGIPVPDAANLVRFTIDGPATIAGVDNGYEASHEPFGASYRKAYNGKCLVILRPGAHAGTIRLRAAAKGLTSATITLQTH
ncbi:MAG TPA: glycoside hydrolase family 2 TIM barrel-domain containing protein [Chitinophagaceae bacterium]